MAFLRNPNQQDLSWFVDMRNQERLELDPPYQRKSVWTYKDKQFFLDTVLNNYPCPAIYLQKDSTPTGPIYNVVDGKQRLSTILDFHDGKIRLSKNFGIPSYQGLKFKDLPENVKSEFYNYIFMVEQIRSDTDIAWGEVFQRVNKNQKTLAEQELRHAKFDGWLITKAEDEAENERWKALGIASKTRKSRMKDVEFISILMLLILEKDFVGFPQHKIDELYAKYDFNLEDLPEDEVALGIQDEDSLHENIAGLTRENIETFQAEFDAAIDFVMQMESHNQCITKHKKRLFTDFYSLWAAIVLDSTFKDMGPEPAAEIYDDFISKIDDAYVLVREGNQLNNLEHSVQVYYGNSTGAATEIEPRRQRHGALLTYANQ